MKHVYGKRYRMSPYLFSISCTLWGLLLFSWCLMFKFCMDRTRGMDLAEAAGTGIVQGVLLISAMILFLLGVFLRNGYEYYGTIEICSDRVIFRTLLRRPRVFLYREIQEIGIDYGLLQFHHEQFCIYFSKVPVDRKYTHNILRLPYSADTMRVQYRRELYDALRQTMSKDRVGKQLCRSHSVIQLHRVNE